MRCQCRISNVSTDEIIHNAPHVVRNMSLLAVLARTIGKDFEDRNLRRHKQLRLEKINPAFSFWPTEVRHVYTYLAFIASCVKEQV